jgi:hypothetical protein
VIACRPGGLVIARGAAGLVTRGGVVITWPSSAGPGGPVIARGAAGLVTQGRARGRLAVVEGRAAPVELPRS